ncbi:MAG: hypothetical protein JOZ51_11660 [Chloroflexi bacterium]|nr:hypothetical protein [Chloroflexota bacterium]
MATPMTEYEWEALPELEGEWEGEGEEFLGSIARGIGGMLGGQGEYEWEGEDEGEGEYEWEGEDEYEGEYESEEFFRRIASLARSAAQSPTLRRVGLSAARAGLRGLGNIGGAIGGQFGAQGAALGRNLGNLAQSRLMGLLPQQEYEGEWEDEFEVNPQQRAYSPAALMEHLGHAAAQAESEAEAEAFIGALVPLAARVIPRAAPAIMRSAPQLVRGLANVTRTLRRTPATRPLVRTLPTVMRRTAANIARQQTQGRPVTPARAVQAMARQTAQVIGSPQQCAQAYGRSRALDRQFHRVARQPQAAASRQREW